MRIGILGGVGENDEHVIFETGENTIVPVTSMNWSGSANIAVHNRHGRDSLVEFTGENEERISLDVVFNTYLGADPIQQVSMMWYWLREGRQLGLVIGEKGYGKNAWLLESISNEMQYFDVKGNVTQITCSLELVEYLSQ